MPRFRAIWHVDATGYSDPFEADSLEHAKQLIEDDDAGEVNRDHIEYGDPIEVVDVIELDDDDK